MTYTINIARKTTLHPNGIFFCKITDINFVEYRAVIVEIRQRFPEPEWQITCYRVEKWSRLVDDTGNPINEL